MQPLADGTAQAPSWYGIFMAVFALVGTVYLVLLRVGERPKLARYASEYLEPGEQIQASFKAFKRAGRSQFLYAVAATDRRIIVLNFGVWRAGPPPRMSMLQPRDVYFHPRRHPWPWASAISLGGEKLTVPRRFFNDVQAADDAFAEMNRAA